MLDLPCKSPFNPVRDFKIEDSQKEVNRLSIRMIAGRTFFLNFLGLAGFKAVYITKKPVRIEKADLVHFLGIELHLTADFDDFHVNPNPFDGRGVNLGDCKSL